MPGSQPVRRRDHRDAGVLAPLDRAATDWLFRLVAVSYVAFSFLDCLTTAYGLAHGGRERNPIAAALYREHGVAALFAFKGLVVVVIVLALRLLPRRPAVWAGTVFAAVAAVAVSANLGAIGAR